MSETTTQPTQRGWLVPGILLAAVGIMVFIAGAVIGAATRHTPTRTVTVTVSAAVVAVDGPATPGGSFSDGLYQVGVDLAAGNYHTDGGTNCYWERLSDLHGGFSGIITNGEPTAPTTVRVLATDKGFGVHGGCTWTAVP